MTNTTFFRPLILLLMVLQYLALEAQTPKAKPLNVLVLLDLSDRLLNRNQAEEDIMLIQSVYQHFYEKSRLDLFINAKHRFRVVVLPQNTTPPVVYDYENQLFLHLDAIAAAQKKQACDKLSNELASLLQRLYKAAHTGSKPEHYAGVDIWRYFNEQLPSDLDPDYDNRIVIFSDGYFDFEDPKHALRKGNRMTYSGYMAALRGKPDWKTQAEQKDFGLMRLNKKMSPARLTVCGIQPKYEQLQEIDMLIYFWEKWAKECGFQFHAISRAAWPKMQKQLKDGW